MRTSKISLNGKYELIRDKFGETIVDLESRIAYAERNSSEREMFSNLYVDNFSKSYEA